MHVRVRLFAALRERVGQAEVRLALPEHATALLAWQALRQVYPDLGAEREQLATAVNRRYASFDTLLADGDELAFIPPVSGG